MEQQNEVEQVWTNEMKELEKEPDDINDIAQTIPDKIKLDQLKKLIETLPKEQVKELLTNLATHEGPNLINPNQNIYSSSSKKEMIRHRLQNKIKQKQFGRQNKQSQTQIRNKFTSKMEALKQAQEKLKEQQGHSHEHVHSEHCGHSHEHVHEHVHDEHCASDHEHLPPSFHNEPTHEVKDHKE